MRASLKWAYHWLKALTLWPAADFRAIRKQLFWEKVMPGPPADARLFDAFEQRYQVALPADVKSNYAIMNGAHDYTDAFGSWMRFWPIEDWRPAHLEFPDDSVAKAMSRHMFVCADHACECVYFVIDLEVSSPTYSCVYGLGGRGVGVAGASFSEFVKNVVNNSDALHSYV